MGGVPRDFPPANWVRHITKPGPMNPVQFFQLNGFGFGNSASPQAGSSVSGGSKSFSARDSSGMRG